MGLDDRDYMQPDFRGRQRPGWLARLRFGLWLVWRRVSGYGSRSNAARDNR